MTARPVRQILERPADAAAEADGSADLPFRIGAPSAQLDLALLRWEVTATVRQRCLTLSPDRRSDLVLVVDELATNAIRYGGDGLVSVMIAIGGNGISLRVYDSVAEPPRLMEPDEMTEGGRGLHLVDELTGHQWGHQCTPGGKYVWAFVTYDPPRTAAAGPLAA